MVAQKHSDVLSVLIISSYWSLCGKVGLKFKVSLVIVLAALVSGMNAESVQAQDTEIFYKGKTINLIVGYPPGGSNDSYARILGNHIGRYIPGHPNVVLRNMPGAGSFMAANYVYGIAPRDGTILALGAQTLALDEKLGTSGVLYKVTELKWIGRISSLVNIVLMWNGSSVATIKDAQNFGSTLAATGVGSAVSIYPTVLNNVVGTKFKLIMGYGGTNEAMLAVERGEVEGTSTTWDALKAAHPMWLQEKKINIPVQFALSRHPELSDIPTAIETAKNDDQRRLLEVVLSSTEIGSSFFTSPGVPEERIVILRKAFNLTMEDEAFKSELTKMRMGLVPMSGQDIEKLIETTMSMSADLLVEVKKIYR